MCSRISIFWTPSASGQYLSSSRAGRGRLSGDGAEDPSHCKSPSHQPASGKIPYEVSGGQKQRAAVARALITDPKLILADEPTGALDSRAASDLLSMFNEVNREGQTILMVTHSAQAASHASRVLFIKDGEVFHQIYRGTKTRQEMYQMIADTLTILTTGSETYA